MTTADSIVKRLRVTFLHRDEQFLYVHSDEYPSDTLLRVCYALVDVNAEFNDTIELLWPQAQLNLLDVSIDEEGALTSCQLPHVEVDTF